MGLSFSSLFKSLLRGEKESRILMLGLDSAGKVYFSTRFHLDVVLIIFL